MLAELHGEEAAPRFGSSYRDARRIIVELHGDAALPKFEECYRHSAGFSAQYTDIAPATAPEPVSAACGRKLMPVMRRRGICWLRSRPARSPSICCKTASMHWIYVGLTAIGLHSIKLQSEPKEAIRRGRNKRLPSYCLGRAMREKIDDIRFMTTISIVVIVGSGLQLLLH